MKKILSLVLAVFVAGTAHADTCATTLMPPFTAAQANALCRKDGTSVAISQIPQTDNTYNLGSASLRWGTEFLGGDLTVNTASKGVVMGDTARASTVTTATTLAAPLYCSNATSGGSDLAAFVSGTATASGANVDFFKTRTASSGQATTIVQSGDTLGQLKFFGANGTTYDPAAAILITSDATPGASADMPGAIDLQTSPDGSATLASVLKLKNDKTAVFAGQIRSATGNEEVVAGAGTNQSNAGALASAKNFHQLTGANGTVGWTFSSALVAGDIHFLLNTTAGVPLIYAPTGGTCNGGGANAACTLVTGIVAHICFATSTSALICS